MKISFETPLKFGFVSGVILIAVSVLMYALKIDPTAVGTSIIVGIITYAVMITFAVVAAIRVRESLEGSINFGNAFLTCFIVFLISFYLTTLYSYIFNAFVDPDYSRIIMEKTIEKVANMVSEEQLDLMIDEMEKSLNPTKNLITNLWSSPIISAILSLIIAPFIKKEKSIQ